jgi:hypothetical protein
LGGGALLAGGAGWWATHSNSDPGSQTNTPSDLNSDATSPLDPCKVFPNTPGCQQEQQQQKSCPGNSKQFGKKFGEHFDPNNPGYRTPQEYRDLADQLYNDPNAQRTTFANDASQYPGETHITDGNGNLLRLDSQGNFRSLYPTK